MDLLPFNTLKCISKCVNLKNVNRIKLKKTLLLKLNEHYNTVRIQRWLRRLWAYNRICPISMEPIRYPCWGYKVHNKYMYYNLPVLAQYFVSSGFFADPSTRLALTKHHIQQIHNVLSHFPHMKKIKLLKAYKADYHFKRQRQIEDQRDVLEDTIRTVVTEMVNDLKFIDAYVLSGNSADLDVNQMLSPKTCEFKICTGILKGVCLPTYSRIVKWSIEQLQKETFKSDDVVNIQNSIVTFMN